MKTVHSVTQIAFRGFTMKHVNARLFTRLGVVLGLAATLVFTPTAFAAAENGAQVINYSDCFEYDGYTSCSTVNGTFQQTMTPSGNASYSVYTRYSETVTNPAHEVVFTYSYVIHDHALTKDELIHVVEDHFTFTVLFDGQTCTGRYTVHIVDDQIQFDRGQLSCS
jgi:hypothetical protein